MDRDAVPAIMRLLTTSVKSGLNASLTPEDSRLLLLVIAHLKDKSKLSSHSKNWIEMFQSMAADAFEALGDDIRKGGKL